jgi:hypothetical protein
MSYLDVLPQIQNTTADKVVKKEWQKLCGQNFACEADALTEAQLWQKTLTYTEHGHKLRILKIRDNIVKIEKVVKRLRND